MSMNPIFDSLATERALIIGINEHASIPCAGCDNVAEYRFTLNCCNASWTICGPCLDTNKDRWDRVSIARGWVCMACEHRFPRGVEFRNAIRVIPFGGA